MLRERTEEKYPWLPKGHALTHTHTHTHTRTHAHTLTAHRAQASLENHWESKRLRDEEVRRRRKVTEQEERATASRNTGQGQARF